MVAASDERSEVLVQQALVVATSSESESALVVSDDVVITVALPDAAAAMALSHGAAVAELTVLRSTRASEFIRCVARIFRRGQDRRRKTFVQIKVNPYRIRR